MREYKWVIDEAIINLALLAIWAAIAVLYVVVRTYEAYKWLRRKL